MKSFEDGSAEKSSTKKVDIKKLMSFKSPEKRRIIEIIKKADKAAFPVNGGAAFYQGGLFELSRLFPVIANRGKMLDLMEDLPKNELLFNFLKEKILQ